MLTRSRLTLVLLLLAWLALAGLVARYQYHAGAVSLNWQTTAEGIKQSREILAREYLWHFLLVSMTGGSLILLAGVTLRHNHRNREINRALISQKNLLTEAERIARMGSWTCDLATGFLDLSDQALAILKVDRATHPPRPALFSERAAAAERDRVKETVEQAFHQGRTCDIEYNLALPAGGETIVHLLGNLVCDENRRPLRMVGTIQDITKGKQVERELTHMVSLLKATLESTADGILVVDRSGKITSYNGRFLKMWQLPAELMTSREDERLVAAVASQMKHPEAFKVKIQQLYDNPLAESFDLLEFKNGHIFERYSKPQLIGGQAVGRVWSFYDVTEQKKADASVVETERRLRTLIEATMDIIFLKDGEGRWQMINHAARKAYSLGNIDYQGKTETELGQLVPGRKADFEFFTDSDLHIWINQRASRAEEYLADDDGRVRCYDMIKVPLYNKDGSRQGLVVMGRDITDRKRTEEDLFKSRETLQMVLNNIPQQVYWKNRDLVFEGGNLPMARDCGLDAPAELIGKTDFDLVDPEEAESIQAAERQVIMTNRPILNQERTKTRADGNITYLVVNKVPLHDKKGQVIGILGAREDITARKVLEAQVHQSQKMESIGRLAGGVAHDFNNLLTVICGYCEILLADAGKDDPSRDGLTEIKKAGERAAALTRQLLSFSRKQILEPAIIDLNALAHDYEKMFRRLLGENVELTLQLSPDLGKIRADASHIDQVFLNLVVNARDAMPHGGKLLIETANVVLDGTEGQMLEEVVSGRYVSLAVHDTGCGMDEKTMAHIFEPFFTTKDLGQGTGLGLAMIFGFIKQSGGHVSVKSEVGAGTLFKIYLPEHTENP
jgi:two-component system cell cycle sensor histidine kinase/response regulator CckA